MDDKDWERLPHTETEYDSLVFHLRTMWARVGYSSAEEGEALLSAIALVKETWNS